MSRSSKHTTRKQTPRTRRRLLSALTLATLSVGGLSTTALAAGYSYQQHIVNAGILVNGSDPAPYLFYVLNNRPDVKPTDVTLVNPLASSAAQPNTAAYWEVQLNSVSDNQLAQYNVLYLPAGSQQFGPVINERLRRFVDNGGQLIVEYGTGVSNAVPGLFTGTGQVAGNASSTMDLPVITAPIFLRHPITSQPYLLSAQDVNALATPGVYISANSADAIHSGEFNNIFSPVLVDTSGSVLTAAQIGAGQVVVSALNIGPAISNAQALAIPNLYAAPTADLKLLANIISWSETHPNQNKSSHGNASNAGLPSFSQAWQYAPPSAGTIAPSGAAVWGNFVFAVDSSGNLDAFDAYPSEYLTAALNPATVPSKDDGIPDLSAGSSYDEIWQQSVGAGASAPTLAAFGGTNYVFVEKNDGTVVCFNAVTGAAGIKLTAPAAGGPFSGTSAPSPTYYDGRLYAGQADGTLHVYDLNEGSAGVVTGVAVPLDPTNSLSGQVVTGPPAVGTLTNGDSNVIVAVVPTNFNIYTVLLGARNEPLRLYTVNNATTGDSINRQGRYGLSNIFADLNAVPSLLAYDSNGNLQGGVPPIASAPNPQDPLFANTTNLGYYTDWNMDFAASVGTGTGTPVNLNYVSGSPFGEINSPTPAFISAPAIDRHGNYYYTETQTITGISGTVTNSYVVGVENASLYTSVNLKFRFLMPTGAINNTDGVNYPGLAGYTFVGAPVVDDHDNVYAVATNGTLATVLCFRGDQQVSAVLPVGSTIDLTTSAITQTDEGGGALNTIQPGPDINIGTANPNYGQFIASTDSISFYNFRGRGGPIRSIAGNLTEPQPVTATPTAGGVGTDLIMRTNLAWYVAPFPITANSRIAGLSLVGSGLLLTDGTSLYKLSTTPLVGSGKEVTALPSVTPIGAGTVGAPPSIGGNVMVINGLNGIAALTRQVTVIADSNRILGVDGSGSAVWAVDATTRVGSNGTTAISTRVPFSHPTALSQFALNDYLVADTGNNRCVRFDSAGNVQWELTRFQDPQGLMATGQSLTLSQPTSVETRQATIATSSNLYPGDAATYYLIADSGNDRLVEVADFVNPTTGNLDGNHVLTWVSHTADRDNRHYRYGSAAYYPNLTNSSGLSIAATVTNLRVAPLAAGQLGPASGDAPGGSIVVFNYPATVQPFSATAPSDLAFTTAGFYAASTGVSGTTYQPFTIRNPRFLQLYTPTVSGAASPVTTVSPFDFLYADDNGTFDLSYDTTKNAFVAGADRLQFTQTAYDTMTYTTTGPSPTVVNVPAFGVPGTISRTGFPFVATCVQSLGTDSSGTGSNASTTRRYLITQNYSQGELGSVNTTTTGTGVTAVTTTTGKIGGEIFEVDVTSNGPSSPVTVTTPGGFGDNQTLSHPDLTGPLTQPTYGVRLP